MSLLESDDVNSKADFRVKFLYLTLDDVLKYRFYKCFSHSNKNFLNYDCLVVPFAEHYITH